MNPARHNSCRRLAQCDYLGSIAEFGPYRWVIDDLVGSFILLCNRQAVSITAVRERWELGEAPVLDRPSGF